MTTKEKIKNDMLIALRVHLSGQQMTILENVIDEIFYNIEIEEKTTDLATYDTTNEYVINLFLAKKATKLSEKTVNQYIRSIRELCNTINKPLTKIDENDIERFLILYKRRGNVNRTVNNCKRFISAFYTWMRKTKLVTNNPCENIDKFKEAAQKIEHLEPEQWEQLKNGCVCTRDRALLEFLRCTAMRDGEVPLVKVRDIDWQDGKIMIYGEKSSKYRIVCIDRVAKKYLRKYLEERGISENSAEPLFAHKRKVAALSKSGIYGQIKKIAERADMNVNVYPHLIRKTTATNIIKRGGNIAEVGDYLGHADNNTAGQYYAYRGEDYIKSIFNSRIAAV